MMARIYAVLRVVLLAAIFVYLAAQILAGRAAIESLDPHWDGPTFVGAFVAALLAYQCLFLGWALLVRCSGHYRGYHLARYLRLWWLSYFYRYVPGKLLLLVERVRLGSALGIPAAAGAAITVIESLLAILAGCAVSLLAVAYYSDVDSRLFAVVALFTAAVVMLLPAGYRLLCDLPILRERYPELGSVRLRYGDVVRILVPYLAHYLLLGASLFLLARPLGRFDWSDLPGLCGIYALSHVISLVALLAPAGLGVREGAFAVQLGKLVPGGVAEALAIGARVWFTLVEGICYLAVVVFCPTPSDRERLS